MEERVAVAGAARAAGEAFSTARVAVSFISSATLATDMHSPLAPGPAWSRGARTSTTPRTSGTTAVPLAAALPVLVVEAGLPRVGGVLRDWGRAVGWVRREQLVRLQEVVEGALGRAPDTLGAGASDKEGHEGPDQPPR